MDFGKAIRVLMEEGNLSRNEVIAATGWSPGYVTSVRSGHADPQARLLEWADVLGVSPTELIQRAESYPDPEPRKVA